MLRLLTESPMAVADANDVDYAVITFKGFDQPLDDVFEPLS